MKPSVLGLAIAAVAFGASTIYLSVQLNEERAQADQVAETMAALNARIAELEKAREQRFAMSGEFGGVALDPAGMAMGPPPPPAEKGEAKTEVRRARCPSARRPPRSEAFEKMMRTNMRANNKRMYADIGEKLGLSKEDTSKLIDMLTDQQVDNFGRMREAEHRRSRRAQTPDGRGAPRRPGGNRRASSAPRKPRRCGTTRRRFRHDRSWNSWRASSKARTPRSATTSRNACSRRSIEERKRIPMPQMSDSTTPEEYSKAYAEWQADYNERVSAQARSILNTEQLAAYTEYQQWQKEMREQMVTRRAGRGRASPGGNVDILGSAAPIAGETMIMVAPAARGKTAQASIGSEREFRRTADPRTRGHLDVGDQGRRHRHGVVPDDGRCGVPRRRARSPSARSISPRRMKPAAGGHAHAENRRPQRNPGSPGLRQPRLHVEQAQCRNDDAGRKGDPARRPHAVRVSQDRRDAGSSRATPIYFHRSSV